MFALTDHDTVGSLPSFSQFDRFGHLIYNAQVPTGVTSYRSYLLPCSKHHE